MKSLAIWLTHARGGSAGGGGSGCGGGHGGAGGVGGRGADGGNWQMSHALHLQRAQLLAGLLGHQPKQSSKFESDAMPLLHATVWRARCSRLAASAMKVSSIAGRKPQESSSRVSASQAVGRRNHDAITTSTPPPLTCERRRSLPTLPPPTRSHLQTEGGFGLRGFMCGFRAVFIATWCVDPNENHSWLHIM